MAIIKKQSLPSGVEFEYHKIKSLQYEEGDTATICLASYLNKATRDAGKEPVQTTVLAVEVTDKSNLIGSAYASLMASHKVNGELITPAVTEQVEATEELPAHIKEITPAVYEQVETNFYADAVIA